MVCLALIAVATIVSAAPPPRSPEVDAGGVTFRLQAPQAKEVALVGQWRKGQRAAMTRNDKGVWSVKLDAVPAGIWEYHFDVDGLSVLDPRNPAIKPQRAPGSSILHVPAVPPAPWDPQDIPHGVLHTHRYVSKSLGGPRELVVYTPPGYRADGAPLPVLYLAHGYSDNEHTWTGHGKAHGIADALIAANRALPLLIVMPDAHALSPETSPIEAYLPGNTAAFIRELREDIRPLIESAYRVRPDAQGRAFAGLSMGGLHALTLGLTHADEFAWIAAFSAAPPAADSVRAALDASAATMARLRLFWVPIGRDDFLLPKLEPFVSQLKTAGLAPEWQVTDGDHSWPVWRGYLAELLPRLFR